MLREFFLQQRKAQPKWEENMAALIRICYSANAIIKDQNILILFSVYKFSLTALDAEMETKT